VTTIVWFRQDLRLADNPALDAAVKRGEPILPLYIWSPEDDGDWPPGAASRWWLHHSLQALDGSLHKRGSRLVLEKGCATEVLANLARQIGATAIFWNRRYEPAAIECSATVKKAFTPSGTETASFNSALLAEPWDVLNQSGKPYRVYTPYLRRLMHELNPAPAQPAPAKLKAPATWPKGVSLASLDFMPRIKWYAGLGKRWQPGERSAQARLNRFITHSLAKYKQSRDEPAAEATSGLSPHLHFGEIGPRQIWHAIGAKGRASTFLHELIWREFAYHLLYHFPETTTKPLNPEFAAFPWKKNIKHLKAWQRGRTGIPMVDAGMHELWNSGFMHNRVRMIVASFLVKNLLQPWQEGTRWFWDTLVDADLANNTLNWQWVAGSGADAAPYFRIFNPVTQARRYDAAGEYVRRWTPQPAPEPIVDLRESREAALDAYADMRRRRSKP
jgi:deoxyribodipyrimidine photo-lyase